MHAAKWVLRVASAAIFFGHGVLALGVKEAWIPFFFVVGMSAEHAHVWMPRVGILDIALAILVLIRPVPLALLWMTLWALWTASLRPLSGEPFVEFVERGGNWGAPLALLLLLPPPRSWRAWLGFE